MLNLFYLLTLLLTAILAAYKLTSLDISLTMIAYILFFAFLNEIIAYWVACKWGRNYFVYNIGMVVDYVLTLTYFIFLFPKGSFASRWLLPALAILGVIFSIVNTILWQPFMSTLNTSFIFLSNLIISLVSLYALFTHFASISSKPVRYSVHFWITILLLINNASPVAIWMSYHYFDNGMAPGLSLLDDLLILINIITVAGIGIVLFSNINRLRHG